MILKVDVDTRRKLSQRELARRARIAHVKIVRCVDTRSPSGRGWHRVLEIERREAVRSQGIQRLTTESKSAPHLSRGQRAPRSRLASAVPFSALEVVALQLLFGSDPIREAFNLHRARVVDAGQVPPFWRRRWDTLYLTHNGKEYRKTKRRSA